MKRNTYLPYLCISTIAIIWNILTMHNFLPWCDEVMLTDAPAHMLLYGEWKTHAFNAMGSAEPYANSLYLWVIFVWLRIFGLSFLSVRLFSLTVTLCVGAFILRFLKEITYNKLSVYGVTIFSIGFWFSSMIALDYRMARYDMLGCLLVVLLANVVLHGWKAQRHPYMKIILLSALTYMEGIPATLYAILIFLFALAFVRPFKKMLHVGYAMASGLGTGFFIVCCIHTYTGHIIEYFFEIINSSGTLQKLWGLAREIILPLLGHEVKALPVQEIGNSSLFDNILRFFDNPSTIILVCVALLLILFNNPLKAFKEKSLPALFAFFSLFVVLFFNLAGRYPIYYRWSAVIPMICAYALWCDKEKKWINRTVVSIACTAFTFFTLIEMGSPNNDTLDRINAFVERQNFKQGDRIATVFSTFYAIKPQTVNSYWYEIYPIDRIGEIDYAIFPEYKKDNGKFFYPAKVTIDKYFESLCNDTLHTMVKIDSMSSPHLVLYSIHRK